MNTLGQAMATFFEQGGPVLWLIFATSIALWTLVLERAWFLRITWPRRARTLAQDWQARGANATWRARKVREAMVAEGRLELDRNLPIIRGLVALCPLLGLLGSVIGMIGVFEVIAVSGNDDPQAMARGIYRATIPTMAGLVVALAGIYFSARLGRLAQRQAARLQEQLALARSGSSQ